MKSNERLGDLHRTEEEIMDILQGLQENLGMDEMHTVIMTIGILYDYPPEEFVKRLGYSVINAVENNNPAMKDDEEAQMVVKLLRKELQDTDSKKKNSNIGYL